MKRRLRMLRSNNGVVPVYGQTANWVSSPERLLPPGFSLTRASTGTYFDSAGLLQTAAIDAARGTYRYNGSAWVFDGTIVEAAATNLCLQSQDFTTTWTASNAATNATISANAATAPDGTLTADALVEDADNGHWVQQLITLTAAQHTYSVFVAPGLRTWCQLQSFDGTTSRNCYFNLAGNGAVGSSSGCTGRIVVAANGFYRCEITFTPLATPGVVYVLGASADGNNNYAGSNGATAFYVWGAQVETGGAATSYIPTTTATVTRSADVVTAPVSGLLVNAQGFAAMKFRYITDTNASWNALLSSYTVGEGMPLAYWGGFLRLFDGTAWRDGPAFTPASGTTYSLASAWASSASALALNGSTASAGFDGSMSLGTTLGIGQNPAAGSFPVSMVLQSLRLGTRAATNVELGSWTV